MLIKVPGVRWVAQRVFRLQRGVTLGVRAMLIDHDNRILLVRHGYAPGWHLPGGGVEAGESLLTALSREVREEAGADLPTPPQLHGVYTNFASFPGDHIALYVIRDFHRERTPAPTFEIREQGFFARGELPADTTAGTLRRIDEVLDGRAAAETW